MSAVILPKPAVVPGKVPAISAGVPVIRAKSGGMFQEFSGIPSKSAVAL